MTEVFMLRQTNKKSSQKIIELEAKVQSLTQELETIKEQIKEVQQEKDALQTKLQGYTKHDERNYRAQVALVTDESQQAITNRIFDVLSGMVCRVPPKP